MVFYQRADIALHANLIAEQQMLKKESEILEQAQRARDDFLSVISKDIIGPLRSIVQWSEQSDAARLYAPNTAMVLYYGGQSAAQACIAVEELIEYSRVSSGKIPIQIVPIDLREELQTFFSQLQTSGQAEPLAYSLHTAGDLPDTLHTDRSLLILALSKLAQYARQESHGGQILISVQLEGVSKLNISASAMSEISENEPHAMQEVHAWASGKGGALKDQSTVVAWALVQSIALRLGAEAGRQSTAKEPPRFWILLPLVPTLIH
jgi:signal transduction histidine kinase